MYTAHGKLNTTPSKLYTAHMQLLTTLSFLQLTHCRYLSYRRSMIADTEWEKAGLKYQIFCLHTIWNTKQVEHFLYN